MKEFVGGISRNTCQDVRDRIIKLSGGNFDPLAVVEKNSNKYIGRCGFIMNKFVGEVEIHIVLKKEMWGKGLGTEIAEALLSLGFNSLGFRRIIGVVHPDNSQSKHVLKKLGMTYCNDISSDDYTNGFQVYSVETKAGCYHLMT
ncbi:MAG TPA: GNAT family N-acetyltransferase [Thermodesulfovibrionales bacterium]|nr:GNAT family N-acetyltransferase [Thermodesulfovibrionales bacterium]